MTTNLLNIILITSFFISFLVQLYYIFFVFSKLAFLKKNKINAVPIHQEGVSVIVAAQNEESNLKRFLPLLLSQEYPDFEVVVVNDRSSDGTFDYLNELKNHHSNLKVVKVDRKPEHINGKKFAITMGIKAAKNEFLLFTDADCVPENEHWINAMSQQFIGKKEIVLGYSQYQKGKGILNAFIRFETFYTAVQYLSLALRGQPYMGVGRNLAYRKKLFFEQNGFFKHLVVTGGDDDLFVNSAATAENTTIAIGKNTNVLSVPKKSWRAWFRQKKRHLSVGKFYKTIDKLRLGVLSISHFWCWVGSLSMVILSYFNEDLLVIYLVAGMMLLRWVAMWIVMYRIKKNLSDELSLIFLPFLDFMYLIYYLVIGFAAIGSKNVKWQ